MNRVLRRERSERFKILLQGKAREWYNTITVPDDWDTMLTMFRDEFSIFGKTEEERESTWQSLSFDRTNGDIEDFLSKVRRLGRALQYRDHTILVKLKQLFPEKKDTWLVVQDLQTMMECLKSAYPRSRLQKVSTAAAADPAASPSAATAQASASTPFTTMMQSDPGYYDLNIGQCPPKSVHFDGDTSSESAVERLTTAVEYLMKVHDDERRKKSWPRGGGRPGQTRPSFRPPKPYKPYITKGRDKSQFRGRPSGRGGDRFPRGRSFSRGPRRDFRSPPRRGRSLPSRPMNRKFVRSPTVRKPRSSSRPVDKDKDRCFRCHEYGHFARECPQKEVEKKELVQEVMRELKRRPTVSDWEDYDGDLSGDFNTSNVMELQAPLNM